MPRIRPGETQDEFVGRCIPIVLDEGTAKDPDQAAAICFSMWRDREEMSKDIWITEAQMRMLCPDCADRMAERNLSRINLAQFKEQMPAQMLRGICDKLGGAEGFFGRCRRMDFGEFSPSDKDSFCAWLHNECTGKWPGEESRQESRMVEITEATITPSNTPTFEGRTWDITIIGPKSSGDIVTISGAEHIQSANGRYYSVNGLRESAPQWEGIKVYDNHLTDEEFEQRAGMRSVAGEWIGTIVNPRFDEQERALRATLKIVDRDLAAKLKAAWDQGVLGSVGLSIDTLPIGHQAEYKGKAVDIVSGFRKIVSLDLVAEPATGGGFNRLIASIGGTTMDDERQEQEPAQEQEETQEQEPMSREELMELIRAMIADALAAKKAPEEAEEEAQESEEDGAEPTPEAEQVQALEEKVAIMECQGLLDKRLGESNLPHELRSVIEPMFAHRIFEEAELMEAIKRAKEAHTAMDSSGDVRGAGGQRSTGVKVGLTERDKMELDFLRLLSGYTTFRNLERIEDDFVKDRLPPAYQTWIKEGRPDVASSRKLSNWLWHICGGDPWDRFAEATTTSDMSSIVKNAVNVLLAADYSKRQRWWEPIVATEEVETIDQATLVRVYGISTLDVVNEGEAYTESLWSDEEEAPTFHKRGNYVGITMETFLIDKVNVIRTIPQRLANSWYNTISALVSGVFTVNSDTGPVLGTTGALFNATAATSTGGHANLLTTALSFSAYGSARSAMLKQTDQALGAGQRLLIEPKFLLVPVDLETTGLQIRNSEYEPGSADNDVNPYYQQVEVVKVPEWTDTNNWALVADPAMFPAIYLIFLRGRRVPELFTANDETAGAMFTNDTIRYKVRLLTWRFSATYDCAPVADFRPLHKSNV